MVKARETHCPQGKQLSLPEKVLTLGLRDPRRRDEVVRRTDSLVLPQLQRSVENWVGDRPLLAYSDSDPKRVTSLLVGEVREFFDEVLLHNGEALRSGSLEMADIYFFVFAFLFGNHIEVDFTEIKNSINGQGASSKSLESLLQICGDLRDYPNANTTSEILILLSSISINLGTFFDPKEVMDHKILINSANYPVEPLVPIRTGKNLTKEKWVPAFDHVVRSLRLIRRANKLSGRTFDTRLLSEDYFKYREFVLNFDHPSEMIKQLGIKLSVDYQIDYNLLMKVEFQQHRIIPGMGEQVIFEAQHRDSGVYSLTRPSQIQRV